MKYQFNKNNQNKKSNYKSNKTFMHKKRKMRILVYKINKLKIILNLKMKNKKAMIKMIIIYKMNRINRISISNARMDILIYVLVLKKKYLF
jgi:hypothetical protein